MAGMVRRERGRGKGRHCRLSWWHGASEGILKHALSHLRHSLCVTRVLVAAHRFGRGGEYDLIKTRQSYELARSASKVIPDGWLLFEDQAGRKYPILLEIDRGMEYQAKFKRHILSRVEFIRSGEYSRAFGTQAVIVSYITTGQTPEYRESRCASMRAWTQEALEESGLERWARIFRFTSVLLEEIYNGALFDSAVWYRPDSPEPVPLVKP